jgi:hypothetical protein
MPGRYGLLQNGDDSCVAVILQAAGEGATEFNLSSHLRLFQYFPGLRAQPPTDPLEGIYPDPGEAAFDLRVLDPVHLHPWSELLLAQAERFTAFFQYASDTPWEGGTPHRHTVGDALQYHYSANVLYLNSGVRTVRSIPRSPHRVIAE